MYNQIRLIKTSVFFLCHWTKQFQRSLANKLIRKVYSPGDILTQTQGNERIYLLSRGKINVQSTIFGKRNISVIQLDPKKEVHFNVYGYSALISGHRINLSAKVQDYSICFYVDKEAVLSAIKESPADFEYFHDIRRRI